ncbi:hypothetical protein BaRGS_00011200 [Batillaria attramentaria]|uniref:Uncharacterized protein n=1 Tax=Batillaria attramentaria TaxID=370345 RepID=A0ABD0LDY9_9CAEN
MGTDRTVFGIMGTVLPLGLCYSITSTVLPRGWFYIPWAQCYNGYGVTVSQARCYHGVLATSLPTDRLQWESGRRQFARAETVSHRADRDVRHSFGDHQLGDDRPCEILPVLVSIARETSDSSSCAICWE